MKKVEIFNSLAVGWSKYTKRPWYLLGIGLVFVAFFILTSSESAMITAMAYVLYAGYLSLMFKHYHGGHVVFDDIFSVDQRWINFGFLALIKSLLIFLGLLCFIVPGIYLAIRWTFAEFYVIDKNMRPIEALRASSALTEGCRWKLFLFSLLAISIVTLSTLAFLVGAVAASVVILMSLIHIYYSLQNPEPDDA